MARERATEAGVGARVALRTIESTHVSPTSTCPHTQRRSHMCAPTPHPLVAGAAPGT